MASGFFGEAFGGSPQSGRLSSSQEPCSSHGETARCHGCLDHREKSPGDVHGTRGAAEGPPAYLAVDETYLCLDVRAEATM